MILRALLLVDVEAHRDNGVDCILCYGLMPLGKSEEDQFVCMNEIVLVEVGYFLRHLLLLCQRRSVLHFEHLGDQSWSYTFVQPRVIPGNY